MTVQKLPPPEEPPELSLGWRALQRPRDVSLPANLAVRLHGHFPGLVTDALSVVGQLLPAGASAAGSVRGAEVFQRSGRWLRLATALGSRAAARNNER